MHSVLAISLTGSLTGAALPCHGSLREKVGASDIDASPLMMIPLTMCDNFATCPAKAFVSLCPNVIEMVGPVDEQAGVNCNTSGCHTAGFRVHLP